MLESSDMPGTHCLWQPALGLCMRLTSLGVGQALLLESPTLLDELAKLVLSVTCSVSDKQRM